MSQYSSLNNQRKMIKTRRSLYDTRSLNNSEPLKSNTFFRSDFNITRTEGFSSTINKGTESAQRQSYNVGNSKEYYKKYEHDDVPVKDESSLSEFRSDATVTHGNRELTNSDLEDLEIRIYNNISKQLQTDDSSTQSSQCNMKLFKTTIQEIFDNFNTNMRDFDHYKMKFHEMIARNKENSIYEMEEFLKEIIKQIVPSESCVTTDSDRTNLPTYSDIGTEVTNDIDSNRFSGDTTEDRFSVPLTVEPYKNDKYLTDTTIDKDSSVLDRSEIIPKTYNIYLLNGHPYIQINMDSRNLLSEINIRSRLVEPAVQIASAENIKRVADKKLQLKNYMRRQETRQNVEKIIPIKISYAKKNIHSEEYPEEFNENNKSFIFKICNYICRKLRKSSFG